jgi:hypothetical protein
VAQSEARLKTAKARWNEAGADQRSQWLDQMDDIAKRLAPSNGSEPRRGFLMSLVGILEPELPLATMPPRRELARRWRSFHVLAIRDHECEILPWITVLVSFLNFFWSVGKNLSQ